MSRLLLAALLPTLAFAGPYCEKATTGADYAPGLAGRYEVVGRLPGHAAAYAGRLEIAERGGAFVLRRTVAGRTAAGSAWIELCSPDRYPVLAFRYAGAAPLAGHCFLRTDGDNYYLLSCRTRRAGAAGEGVESLFQMREP